MQVSIGNALADQKVFLQGCDTHGRAVIVVLGVRHLTQTRDLEETIRLIIYVLDHAVAASDPVKNPARQIICLLDLGGMFEVYLTYFALGVTRFLPKMPGARARSYAASSLGLPPLQVATTCVHLLLKVVNPCL